MLSNIARRVLVEQENNEELTMNIEEIIRAWKAGKANEVDGIQPANPVGDELSAEELEEVVGGQREAFHKTEPYNCPPIIPHYSHACMKFMTRG